MFEKLVAYQKITKQITEDLLEIITNLYDSEVGNSSRVQWFKEAKMDKASFLYYSSNLFPFGKIYHMYQFLNL